MNRALGFSKADRDEHVARIAAIDHKKVHRGRIVLVVAILPYLNARAKARRRIGNSLEVNVDAPLELCLQRDAKRLYVKALEGKLSHFTGINDPYEPTPLPDLHLDTAN